MANSRDFHGTLFARHGFDASFAKENLGFNNRQLIAMKFPVDELKALGMTDEEINDTIVPVDPFEELRKSLNFDL